MISTFANDWEEITNLQLLKSNLKIALGDTEDYCNRGLEQELVLKINCCDLLSFQGVKFHLL